MTFDSDINTSSNSIYTSTYNLSPSGVLNSVNIVDGRPRTVTFKTDMNGMVIRRDESDNISTQGDPHNVYFRFDGKEIASVGNVAPTDGSPWQNGYVERLIGSIRRECLDHMIVINARHLRRALGAYVDYYNNDRTHLGLNKDAPNFRPLETAGTIISQPILGGLHHRYRRK